MGCILAKILEMGCISRILWVHETICYMGFLQAMCQQMKKDKVMGSLNKSAQQCT
jgi:hypothetical protein